MISKKSWTNYYQNLQYIRIFGSLAFYNILDKKKSKSNYQKVEKKYSLDIAPIQQNISGFDFYKQNK